jgi:hypothetical protein
VQGAYLLTPTALRWSTLSSASGKEGKTILFFLIKIFFSPALSAASRKEGEKNVCFLSRIFVHQG